MKRVVMPLARCTFLHYRLCIPSLQARARSCTETECTQILVHLSCIL